MMLTSSRWRTWEYHGRESFVESSWYARVSSAVYGNIVFQPHYRTDDSKYYAATQVFKSNPSRLYSGLASAILDEQPSAKSTSCIVIDTRDWSVMQETVMNTTTRKVKQGLRSTKIKLKHIVQSSCGETHHRRCEV